MNRAMLKVFGVIALGIPGGIPLGFPPSTPVADAAMRGDGAAVRALVATGADVNVAQGDGMTALHWAANRGDSSLAVVLLRAKAHLSATTRNGGYTPLHVASQSGATGVVRALLAAKADARATTTDGASPLHLAAVAGVPGTISALIAAGRPRLCGERCLRSTCTRALKSSAGCPLPLSYHAHSYVSHSGSSRSKWRIAATIVRSSRSKRWWEKIKKDPKRLEARNKRIRNHNKLKDYNNNKQ